MNTTPWHADDDALVAYSAGGCDPVLAASLETHLVRCERCRAALARVGGHAETDRRWEALADVVDRPSRTLAERLGLERLEDRGVTRVALASPALRWAWLASLVLVVAIPAVAAAMAGTDGATALLALAPVAPALAVALAYRETADPAGELALAAPTSGLRLVAVRSLLVCAAAVPLSLGLAVLNGLAVTTALSWVLPGMALAALVLLAGTTRLDPIHVAAALTALWAITVVTPSTTTAVARDAAVQTVTSPALQLAALTVAAVALLITIARRDAVAYRRTA